ncbi:MAG: transglycosylase SLT domain-containing protein [Bacteroidales bacterium]
MIPRTLLRAIAILGIGALIVGCGPQLQTQPPRTVPTPAPQPSVPAPPKPIAPPVDPVASLIETSQRHFETGQAQLQLGHLERAKAEFNLSVQILLQSPYGARSDNRIREHFDRLVDRISTYEVTALTQGDGFTETKSEPASIDQFLAISTFENLNPSPRLEATVKHDLDATAHDIPIPLNARVLAYIDLFQGRLRDWIQDGLVRGARYLPMIQDVFRAEGLPLDLAYVPLIESAFKPNAVSRAKAKGVWQFMKGTAGEHGLKQDWYIDERSDPEKATVAAAKYLRTLASIFDGDWHLALASYNGGPGRVQRALARAKLDDFWSLADKPKLLPRETREYVPMILAAIVIARNPVEYGFEVGAQAPLACEKVKVPAGHVVDLRRVAEWTGTSISEIQGLNPELQRLTTPIKYTSEGRPADYELKVPAGTAASLSEHLEQASDSELNSLKWYPVQRGESLLSISRKLGVSQKELAAANYLSAKSRVQAGQSLIIPRDSTLLLAARADRPAPPAASRVVASNAMVTEAPTGTPSEDLKLIYKVKRGDTLSSVARLYRTTVESLKVWNHLRTSALKPGDRLTIFARRGSAAVATSGIK